MPGDTQVEMGSSTRVLRGRKGGPGSPKDAMELLIYLNGSSGTHSEEQRGRQSQSGSLIMFK